MGDDPERNERLYAHLVAVLSVSAGMVGACLTAIGLIGVMRSLGTLETVVDDLLAVSAVLFLVTATLSFLGMRTRLATRWRGFGWTLDALFFSSLLALVAACLILAWAVI